MLFFVGQRNEPEKTISKYGMFVSKSSEPKSAYQQPYIQTPEQTIKQQIILTH